MTDGEEPPTDEAEEAEETTEEGEETDREVEETVEDLFEPVKSALAESFKGRMLEGSPSATKLRPATSWGRLLKSTEKTEVCEEEWCAGGGGGF